ncbi:malonate decarboxylase holo-ACP synthase [Pseudomonas putida]|uniref:Phosphoribosyl-dephospho-CoA transferase n=1 Tax=Pseudomonas putida TaxID=303 RepID=A0A7W2L1Y5_PSEPU|nr:MULTISPECIES: malonate decarboxylase holo-ACP synthase [Pseudomonas]MBA6116842.1 malonate decarboxylase holo-ACP synthase [Pseudomonas putida]MBI6944641.1 malonate decarboxylase holo-ACP synthase [Pseudomonas putida]MBI6959384.1 malonate decarboxylase holo-ACP synthase [Pseudomonas putida]MCZ9637635.1 malonate decarboxylase holo-ACP synthase [Pseudomonas putida]MEC4876654.1 malonate decarboxylase holo-ACP synthase [Pseudomonas sp. NC26]
MRAPQPHDLLWGMLPATLPDDAPAWAAQVLAHGQPVVVRRAVCDEGWVAVGVRGEGRAQRLGAQMRLADIRRQMSPEALRWQGASPWAALQALASVAPVLDASGLAWGPTGSVGYHLACGIASVHAASDLDLVVRAPQPLARAKARELLDSLDCGPCRIDVQLETPTGAIALREWAGAARRVLLKSAVGARLVADPWNLLECAA